MPARLRSLTPLGLVLALLAPAGPAAADQPAKPGVYQRTLRATVWVRTPKGSGTGWVVDRARKLVITNHHVVGTENTVSVTFPAYRDGRVIAERAHYLKNGRTVRGKVLTTDPRRDLAAVQLDTLPDGVGELKLAADSASPSDRVHSVGNPGASDALWVYTSGTVRQVYRRRLKYKSGQQVDARVVETQSPINPGDSGGPVVNDDGQLLGVTASQRTDAQLVSYCIDVSEVRGFVDRARTFAAAGPREGSKEAGSHREQGLKLLARGEYDKAIEELTQAVRLNPKDAAAYRERGLAYRHRREYDKAVEDYTRALRLDPKDVIAYNNRAAARYNRREYDAAIEDCNEALRLDAKYALAYKNRGLCYAAKADYERAVKDFSEAIRLEPKDALAYRSRAVAYRHRREYPKALADNDTAIRLNPKDAVAYNNRAVVHNFLGDRARAIADCTEAVRLEPKYALAYKNRGLFHAAAGDYDKALADYDQTIKLSPRDAEAYLLRSRVHRRRGDAARADADYNEAVRIDPGLKKREK